MPKHGLCCGTSWKENNKKNKNKKKEFTALGTIAKEAKRDRGREKKGEKEWERRRILAFRRDRKRKTCMYLMQLPFEMEWEKG